MVALEMSKENIILFDFSTYKYKYNLKKILLDLLRVKKYLPTASIYFLDSAKKSFQIENELYCNLPINYVSTYIPHTTLDLCNKLITKGNKYLIVSESESFYSLISQNTSLVQMFSDTEWVYWDAYKFQDKYGHKPHLWKVFDSFSKIFGDNFPLDNPDNKSILINLFSNFKDLRVALNYLKEEVIPKEKWLVDNELALIEAVNPSEENLIDYISYNYNDNEQGFYDLLDSLDLDNKEEIIKSLLNGFKFKTS